jgi:PAS domain-containing protein
MGKDAALMLDITGRISAANAAAALLLGRPPGSLCGLAASALMPQLPFAADTPGYNMAYAIFHTGDARWQPHQAIAADGRRVAIELVLACSSLEGRRVITLSLRPAAPQSREAP